MSRLKSPPSFYPIILFFITTTFVLHCCDSKNILVHQAVGTHSTRLSMWPYIEALAANGHNVTFLTAYPDHERVKKHPNINYYVPAKLAAAMAWDENYGFYDLRKNNQVVWTFYSFHLTGLLGCSALFTDPDFVDWVKSSSFDLVIVESVVNECAYGLAHYFKAKYIIYVTCTSEPNYIDQHGFPVESSSIPDISFSFPPGVEMSLWQRILNTLQPIGYTLNRKYFYMPLLAEIVGKGLGIEGQLPSFEEIERNASLILLTSHYSMDYPRSFPPHVIPIGGVVAASNNRKPMPKELEKFVNDTDANVGFIYISFGSVAEFTNFDQEVQQEFIKGLLKFPKMRYVWSLPKGINATLPDNILVTKWAPQQTILAHPKIKAFISHAGMGSTTEAVHYSVPLICLPIMADQDLNANSVARKGAGINLEIVGLKASQLEYAISEILHNEQYRKNMNTLSEIFHERPVPPLETAVWWTEFILKHNDSNKYLLPPSIPQPWYIKRGLDVWMTVLIFVGVTLSLCLYTLFWVITRIVKILVGKNSAARQSAKKLKRK